MESQLSNEQLKFLHQVSEQGVLVTSMASKPICKYLQSNGYVDFYQVLVTPSPELVVSEKTLTVDLDSSALMVQITEKGKAYVSEHTAKKRDRRIELFLSISAIVISIVFGILGLIF